MPIRSSKDAEWVALFCNNPLLRIAAIARFLAAGWQTVKHASAFLPVLSLKSAAGHADRKYVAKGWFDPSL
jgi:hypothetical protein